MSAQSAVASMKTVKRAAIAARFAFMQRVAPGASRDHARLFASLSYACVRLNDRSGAS